MKKEIRYFNNTFVKKTKNIGMLCALITLVACDGSEDTPDPIPEVPNPTVATLVFPESNSECIEGSNITSTESTINFEWNAATHTDSYSVQLKDLETGSSTLYSTTNTTYAIKLKRGTPYSWSVISKSNKTPKTATSTVWKFYNAGAGNASYAPFPAEVVSPEMGASVAGEIVNLDWTGNDIDGDIESFDVYFGESETLEIYNSNIEESILNNVSVASEKTYYWKVATKDTAGNISHSDVFKFVVE